MERIWGGISKIWNGFSMGFDGFGKDFRFGKDLGWDLMDLERILDLEKIWGGVGGRRKYPIGDRRKGVFCWVHNLFFNCRATRHV